MIVWVFLPDDVEGWEPYTFDKELAAMEAKYAVPDEENAAKIYSNLLASHDLNDFEPNFTDADTDFWDLARSGPWRSEDYPEVAEWLNGHRGTINTLMEAAKKEKCHFPIQADPMGIGCAMDRLAPMRQWAHLLVRAGNNDLGEGRTNAAIEKYIAVMQMGKHLCQQPALIDSLVGFALEALAIRQFDRFVIAGDATEEHLSTIGEGLTEVKHNLSSDLPKFLNYDKLIQKNLWGMFYEVNMDGEIRLTHDITASIKRTMPKDIKDEITLTYWQKKLVKVTTILSWLYMPSTPQGLGKIIDECYEKYYAMAEPNFDWSKKPREFSLSSIRFNCRYISEMLASLLEPVYYSIHYTYLQANAEQRGSQIIIALRRYKNKNGRWPESLEEIKSLALPEIFVDPINNGSFVYKLTEKDFTLYSKGKNNIDEDGEYNSNYDPNSGEEKITKDDRLIWPARSCKDKEEKEDEQQ